MYVNCAVSHLTGMSVVRLTFVESKAIEQRKDVFYRVLRRYLVYLLAARIANLRVFSTEVSWQSMHNEHAVEASPTPREQVDLLERVETFRVELGEVHVEVSRNSIGAHGEGRVIDVKERCCFLWQRLSLLGDAPEGTGTSSRG